MPARGMVVDDLGSRGAAVVVSIGGTAEHVASANVRLALGPFRRIGLVHHVLGAIIIGVDLVLAAGAEDLLHRLVAVADGLARTAEFLDLLQGREDDACVGVF